MPTIPARVLYRDDLAVLATWSNLLITDMRGDMQRDQLIEIVKAFESMQKIYPDGVAALTLIPQSVPIGDGPVRKEAGTLLQRFGGAIRHISIVLEGSGIWAGTMRTVLRGLAVVGRTPFAMKVHDNVEAAARGLAPVLADVGGQKPTEWDVIQMLKRLRA
jgi:hypothetical protein